MIDHDLLHCPVRQHHTVPSTPRGYLAWTVRGHTRAMVAIGRHRPRATSSAIGHRHTCRPRDSTPLG
eukprot:53318-Prymnesium_polylepis.1